jgi:hypothetical protein
VVHGLLPRKARFSLSGKPIPGTTVPPHRADVEGGPVFDRIELAKKEQIRDPGAEMFLDRDSGDVDPGNRPTCPHGKQHERNDPGQGPSKDELLDWFGVHWSRQETASPPSLVRTC